MTSESAWSDDRRPFDDAPLSQAVFRLARLHKSIAARLLRDTGLRPGQEIVLMTLWAAGPQRLVDLVQTLGSDAPTMTRSIARLEKAGWVTRSRSPQDGRAVIVQATDDSLSLRPRVDAAWAALEKLTIGSASKQRQADLLGALQELESHLGSIDDISCSDKE